jgi:hypothetical protein
MQTCLCGCCARSQRTLQCCLEEIERAGRQCTDHPPPCVISKPAPGPPPGPRLNDCLYALYLPIRLHYFQCVSNDRGKLNSASRLTSMRVLCAVARCPPAMKVQPRSGQERDHEPCWQPRACQPASYAQAATGGCRRNGASFGISLRGTRTKRRT